MKLIIGSKNKSSWSLRPWLLMKYFNIEFEEILIHLDQNSTRAEIAKYSASGKVPVLIDGLNHIWDSLAICEHLNEKYPDKLMWPLHPAARSQARSISCEMHSSFATMRTILNHDISAFHKGFDSSKARSDINRIFEIWQNCLTQFKGPFLFGNFTIADAMFAPVVNRFVTYDVDVPPSLREYMNLIRELPASQEWIKAAKAEKA